MEHKEKVKYLDLVFKNIENTDKFTIENILHEKLSLSDNNIDDIGYNLRLFGKKHELFTVLSSNKCDIFLQLTPKGEKLKAFEKGFEKFEESLDEKNTLEVENLKLQNEAIEYSKTIRNQEERIRNLDESLKIYDFVKKYWIVILIILLLIYKVLEKSLVYLYNTMQ
ncbi:hypothetical protein [Polaribacter sp.]|uniref:hypothetical protein n=1 Tax=Polaribacter sp. TaxID=1920175 RepID=UPI004048E7EC